MASEGSGRVDARPFDVYLPAHGFSDHPTQALAVPDCAACVREVLHALRRTTMPLDETGFPLMLTLKEVLGRSSDPLFNQPRNPTQAWVDEENRAAVLGGRDFLAGLTGAAYNDKRSALVRVVCPTLLL